MPLNKFSNFPTRRLSEMSFTGNSPAVDRELEKEMERKIVAQRPGMQVSKGYESTPRVMYKVEKNHVLMIELPNEEYGLYYSANVVVEIKEKLQSLIKEKQNTVDYWVSRCEDIETAYNLQKSVIERDAKKAEEDQEKIRILSEALTNSKFKERGKIIQISKLKRRLAKKR